VRSLDQRKHTWRIENTPRILGTDGYHTYSALMTQQALQNVKIGWQRSKTSSSASIKDSTSRRYVIGQQPACDPETRSYCHAYFRSNNNIVWCCSYHNIVQILRNISFFVGTGESAICIRIESRIESGVKIRIRIESSNRIFQLQRILIIKISNYEWNKRDVWNYIFLITILKHIKLPAYDHS